MLIFDKPIGEDPEFPLFMFDNTSTGLLMLNLFCGIRIRNLEASSLEALSKTSEIHIVEKDGEEIVKDYLAAVKKVSDISAMIL